MESVTDQLSLSRALAAAEATNPMGEHARALRSQILAAHQQPARTYLVGLPVLVTVYDTGLVEYAVDTAETGEAIRETEVDPAEQINQPAEAQRLADAARADADHTRRQGV